MARKNAIVSVSVERNGSDATDQSVTFTVEGQSPIQIRLNELSTEIRAQAMIHGITQKISDAAALGKDATPADKYAAMLAVAERISSPNGSWNKRNGEGSESAPSGLIFRAFYQFAVDRAEAMKKPIPAESVVRELYDSKTRSEQLAIRKIPEVAAIMERMKGDKLAKSAPDADALLADILG